MAAIDKELVKAKGGVIAPQHYNATTDSYEAVQGANGASFVTIKNPVSDVTLQNAVTAIGNGTKFSPTDGNYILTFEIVGTSTSRTVAFEIAGPSGTYVPCTGFNVTDPKRFSTETTGGNNTVPESWQVEVPAGYSFRTRVSAVAGGNVTVKGKAVI